MSRLDPLAVSRGTDGSNPASSTVVSMPTRGFLPRGFSDACLRAAPPPGDWQASENPERYQTFLARLRTERFGRVGV